MRSKTVLIADDDPELIKSMTIRCHALGLAVRAAANGREALDMVTAAPPDLLILDLNMPAMDGLTVCETLVRDHQIPLFPVLLLTGTSDHETVRRCVATGAHYGLKGPDVWQKMEPVIRRLLELSPGDVPGQSLNKTQNRGPLILVVDDDPDFTRAMALRLNDRGFNVSVAHNGRQGYWKALAESPDVIVTDLTMPEMSGEALMRKLMYGVDTADIPIIVMTGQRFEGGTDNALKREMKSRQNVVAFLTKPFELDELIGEIGRHVVIKPARQDAQ